MQPTQPARGNMQPQLGLLDLVQAQLDTLNKHCEGGKSLSVRNIPLPSLQHIYTLLKKFEGKNIFKTDQLNKFLYNFIAEEISFNNEFNRTITQLLSLDDKL